MKGDLPQAAQRLMQQLPVRTHERRFHHHTQGSRRAASITIDGRTFESIIEAKRALHKSSATIEKWLATGRAVRG